MLVLSYLWAVTLPVSGIVCKYFAEGDLSQTMLLPQGGEKKSAFNELSAKVD